MWDLGRPGERERAAHAEAAEVPFWLDRREANAEDEPLEGATECDLAIVGGGLSGLWAAVQAKEEDPGREVVLLEGAEVASAASGRNGGFFLHSLTHGMANGLARFPDELPTLERLGRENHRAAVETIRRLGIDCDLELNGDVVVAIEPHEEGWLAGEAEALRAHGNDVDLLDAEGVRAEVRSPMYRAGLWQRNDSALVDPAKLCWGLRDTFRAAGGRVYERTRVERLLGRDAGIELRTEGGTVRARHTLLATSAFPALVRSVRRRVVPVYDYVLVTEPLGAERLRELGWERRQGLSDCANHFHYYRLTADSRILFGGYDAVYHYADGMGHAQEQRLESFDLLAQHLFAIFPQLEGIRFSHRWGGAIDTCTRFFAFHGTSHGGRVAHTVGHTGLGVGASRFGARVALDLLAGRETEATQLEAIRSRPLPFPPEPLRWAGIELTRNRLAAADRNAGRRGLWLRTLDRLGLGYDS